MTAGQDYIETATSVFFDQSSVSVPVDITDDVLFETPESFFGLLSNDSDLPANVYLASSLANAIIIDNDGMQLRSYLLLSRFYCLNNITFVAIVIGFDSAT